MKKKEIKSRQSLPLREKLRLDTESLIFFITLVMLIMFESESSWPLFGKKCLLLLSLIFTLYLKPHSSILFLWFSIISAFSPFLSVFLNTILLPRVPKIKRNISLVL